MVALPGQRPAGLVGWFEVRGQAASSGGEICCSAAARMCAFHNRRSNGNKAVN